MKHKVALTNFYIFDGPIARVKKLNKEATDNKILRRDLRLKWTSFQATQKHFYIFSLSMR